MRPKLPSIRSALAMFTLLLGAASAQAQLVTFEPNPSGLFPDGTVAVDDAPLDRQFESSNCVRFFVDIDGDLVADDQPILERVGTGPIGLDGFLCDGCAIPDRRDNPDPSHAGELGNFFLRYLYVGGIHKPTEALVIAYTTPVETPSFEVWDIDGSQGDAEQYRIEALDATGALLGVVTTPVGLGLTLNGRPWLAAFDVTGSGSGISFLRVLSSGSRDVPGLAFDNFTTDCAGCCPGDSAAPTLSSLPGPITITCSTELPAPPTVTASDTCDPSVEVDLVTGPLVGTECNGTITRTWTATDGCGNDITHVQLITVRDDADPAWTSALPGPITITCSTALPAPSTLTAADDCDPSVAVNLVTGPLVGTQCNGTITRTWTATDDCGNDITHVQIITVRDDVDPAWTSALPGPITVTCSTALPAPSTLTAADDCDPSVAVNLVTGPLVGTECNGTITRTWTATDGCGNDITHVQIITVRDDVDPAWTSALPGPITITCSTDLPAPSTLTASDDCDTSVAVNLVTGPLVGTECNGTITRTWTATDDCGNDITHVQIITVRDDVDPVINGVPDDITVECDAIPDPAEPTVSDNCDTSLTLDYAEVRTDGNCEDNYTLTRTWTATDACNNVTVETQVITVQDTTDPVVMGVLEPVAALPAQSASSAASVCSAPASRQFRLLCEIDDNCDDMPVITAKLVSTQTIVEADGSCTPIVTEVEVACDQVVEIVLLATPCPADGPASAGPATSVNSSGTLIVYGESVVLEVQGEDRCGNLATDTFDPATEPSTLCDEVLEDGTCCPAVGQPPTDCESPCGPALKGIAPQQAATPADEELSRGRLR